MKNKLIIAGCSILILGFLILGVTLVDRINSLWLILLTALIIIPSYFLYNAILDLQYEKQQANSRKKRNYKKPLYTRKKTNDNGKILYFPSDKNKTKRK